MRVLVLSPANHDPATRDLLRSVAGAGCEVVAATPGGTAGTDGEVRLVPVAVRGPADDARALRWHKGTLSRVLSDVRPDVVHVDAEPDTPLAALAAALCRRIGTPFVLFSESPRPPGGGPLSRRRAAGVLKAASGLIGGTRRAESCLAERTSGILCTTLPRHGVPVPAATEREPGEELSLGFVGRLVPDRGLEFLLQALAQTYGKWRLTVLGTGPEQEAMEALAGRHGLASRIRWWGGLQRDQLDRLWPEIDGLVVPWQPSSSEPSAPLLLEAMARGLGTIVTDTEPLPELVGDAASVVGSVEELAETLQGWVASPARPRAAGVRGRQRVLAEFVTSAVASRLLEFWRAVAAERKLVTS